MFSRSNTKHVCDTQTDGNVVALCRAGKNQADTRKMV